MKGIIIILILFSTQLLMAQNIKVIDQRSLKPVESVFIFSPSNSSITNYEGEASLEGFHEQEQIKFQHPYYSTRVLTMREIRERDFLIRLKENPIHLDEVLIAANKREQKRSEIAARIVSISSKELEFYNPQTAADLVGVSSEVFIQKSQFGGGSPMIRGFAANRILLVVDGVRMNNAIFRSGNLQNVIALDPGSIERSEIIYGPSSMIYGSDALGGVLSFSTQKPRYSTSGELFKLNVASRYATASEEKTAHVDVNYGRKKVSMLTSVSASSFGDLRMGSNEHNEYQRYEYVETVNGKDSIINNSDPRIQKGTGYDQLNVMQKLRWMPDELTNIDYSFHLSTTTNVPRYDRLIQYKGDKLKYANWYYGPQKWMMNHLTIERKQLGNLADRAAVNIAWQRFQESRHDRKLNKSSLRRRTEKVNVLTCNADFDKVLANEATLFYGVEFLTNKVSSSGYTEDIHTKATEESASRYPDGASLSGFAAYLSYEKRLTEALKLSTGVRYNYISSKGEFDQRFYDFPFDKYKNHNGALTGSAGLVYRPTKEWQLNVNLSSGFRAPNVDDAAKVFDSEPGTVIVPNPNLNPEYAVNGELGIIRYFGENAQFEFSGYYTRLFDAMVRREFSLDGQEYIEYDGEMSRVEALTNSDYANIYGCSAGLTVKLAQGLTLKNNISLQTGEDSDGKPLRHIAPTFGSSHLLYNYKQVKFDVYALFNGEISYGDLPEDERDKPHLYAKDASGNPYSPSWLTFNFKTSMQLNSVFQVNLGIENIMDLRYRPYSSGVVSPGRNVVLSVRASI
ncbi:TonB-dependent receptor [Puteibacter caeruleilacunae]|nr:TonB-dependent receptor [Puteibacter caeruleilacunae]